MSERSQDNAHPPAGPPHPPPHPQVPGPAARRLHATLQRLIRAGVPTQAYAVSMGSFDTHSGEKPTHDQLLGQLDSALDTFLTSIASSPHAGRLVVMIYSEFGRRVVPNASGGTDHGKERS